MLGNSLKNSELKTFIQKYDTHLKKMELMFGPFDMESYLQSIVKYTDEVLEIGKIFKNNFQTYHLNIWSKEKEKLEKTAIAINNDLQKLNLIGHWEKLTGLKFKTDEYQIVLFSANKNGPSANSLGYERNAFYYDLESNMLLQFISHEVGTHILIDIFVEVMQMNKFNIQDLYVAYENLAEFYNVEFIFKGKPIFGYTIFSNNNLFFVFIQSERSEVPIGAVAHHYAAFSAG